MLISANYYTIRLDWFLFNLLQNNFTLNTNKKEVSFKCCYRQDNNVSITHRLISRSNYRISVYLLYHIHLLMRNLYGWCFIGRNIKIDMINQKSSTFEKSNKLNELNEFKTKIHKPPSFQSAHTHEINKCQQKQFHCYDTSIFWPYTYRPLYRQTWDVPIGDCRSTFKKKKLFREEMKWKRQSEMQFSNEFSKVIITSSVVCLFLFIYLRKCSIKMAGLISHCLLFSCHE